MTTPSAFPSSRGHSRSPAQRLRTLVVSLAAYVSAVSASVAAAATLVGVGVPLDILVAVI